MIKAVFKPIAFIFRGIGVLLCLCYIALSSSKLAHLLRKKQKVTDSLTNLKIDFVQMPELGKKLQQSFK